MTKHIDTRTVVREGEAFVASRFSVTVPGEHTCHEEALRMVYEEMLRAGCGTYTRSAFQDALHILGADMGVSTEDSTLTFHFTARNEVLAKALSLYKTFITAPTFHAKELTRVKEHLTNTLALTREDAKGRAQDAFINATVTVRDWRFTYSIDEYIAAVRHVTRADLVRFHARIFTHDWKHTCGGGATLCTLITKTLTSCAPTQCAPAEYIISSVRILEKTHLSCIDIPAKQNIELSIGGTLPITFDSPDIPALTLGMNVLGMYGGFSGRLMSTVREKEGLTYGIYSRLEDITRYDEGYWRIMTFFNTNDVIRGIEATLREVRSLVTQGITKDELARFKTIMRTRRVLEEDALLRVLASTHARHQADIDDAQYSEYLSRLEALTLREVNDTLKRFLAEKPIIISAAGPVAAYKEKLTKIFGNMTL